MRLALHSRIATLNGIARGETHSELRQRVPNLGRLKAGVASDENPSTNSISQTRDDTRRDRMLPTQAAPDAMPPAWPACPRRCAAKTCQRRAQQSRIVFRIWKEEEKNGSYEPTLLLCSGLWV